MRVVLLMVLVATAAAQDARGWLEDLDKINATAASTTQGQEKSLLEELTDLFSYGLSRLFQDSDDGAGVGSVENILAEADTEDGDEDDEEDEEGKKEEKVEDGKGRDIEDGRGKKKKKRRALMKLFMLAMLIKSKISMLFGALSGLLQLKFFGLALANFLIGLIRLYIEWANKKQPQKVIYYEHAQHQHHYEHEHHYDEEQPHKGSGWSGLWSGRSIPDAQQRAYAAYAAS